MQDELNKVSGKNEAKNKILKNVKKINVNKMNKKKVKERSISFIWKHRDNENEPFLKKGKSNALATLNFNKNFNYTVEDVVT